MNDFLKDIMRLCAAELQAACDEHGRTYPDGDWKSANSRIGKVRYVADAALHASGSRPSGRRMGNDEVLKCLFVMLDLADPRDKPDDDGAAGGKVVP